MGNSEEDTHDEIGAERVTSPELVPAYMTLSPAYHKAVKALYSSLCRRHKISFPFVKKKQKEFPISDTATSLIYGPEYLSFQNKLLSFPGEGK